MDKPKSRLYILIALLSILLIVIGASIQPPALKALTGILMGVGAGLFGLSVAKITTLWIEAKNPAYKHKVDIEASDERNQAINNLARGRAFEAFTPVFGVLMLVFVLIGVDLLPELLLVAAYLAVYGVYFYHIGKLGKEM